MIFIIFIIIKLFTDVLFPIDRGFVILEEAAPIRIEICYH